MPPKPSVPHRPSVSEIALALAQRQAAPISSVRVWTNAAGEPQWEVEVKRLDPYEAHQIALELADKCQKKYVREEKPPRKDKTTVVHVTPKRGRAA